jgi:hypothetical protein
MRAFPFQLVIGVRRETVSKEAISGQPEKKRKALSLWLKPVSYQLLPRHTLCGAFPPTTGGTTP